MHSNKDPAQLKSKIILKKKKKADYSLEVAALVQASDANSLKENLGEERRRVDSLKSI